MRSVFPGLEMKSPIRLARMSRRSLLGKYRFKLTCPIGKGPDRSSCQATKGSGQAKCENFCKDKL